MADYCWASPGGVYVVPERFKQEFLAEFPDYRIRWSLQKTCWVVEQAYTTQQALPTHRDDPNNDDVIRKRDGYWRVMEFFPGDRMECKGLVSTYPIQRCETTLKIPHYWSGEVRCPTCLAARRDGRNIVAYWPFGSRLLEFLKYGDPLKGGIQRSRQDVDAKNERREVAAAKRTSDAVTSIDAVDYRWISGIASSTGLTRRTINEKDLE